LNTLNQNTSGDYTKAFDFVLEHGNGDSNMTFEDPAQSWTRFESESPGIDNSNLQEKRESYFTLDPDEQPSVHPDAREKFDDCEKRVHQYMLDRGFREDVCIDWGVRVETNYCGSERVVLPVYNYNNDLVAYTRRVVWDKPTCQVCGHQGPEMSWHGDHCPECDTDYDSWFVWPKYQHSKGFNRNYLLYGEHLINPDNSKGVLVEGNLDAMRLYQYGIENAVALMGSKVGKDKPGHQMYRLGVHFDDLLIMADGDEAGRDMAETVTGFYQRYPDKLTVNTYVCPDGRDPGDMDRKNIQNTLDKLGFYS
jgi:5S rRNA maturation endonuclease (ribonuclease M5)